MYSETSSSLLFLVHSLTLEFSFLCFPFHKTEYGWPQLMNLSVTVSVVSRDCLVGSPFLLLGEIGLVLPEPRVTSSIIRGQEGESHNIGRATRTPLRRIRSISQRSWNGLRAVMLSFGKEPPPPPRVSPGGPPNSENADKTHNKWLINITW